MRRLALVSPASMRPCSPARRSSMLGLVIVVLMLRTCAAMIVHFCPRGMMLETGLCYPRCRIGYAGVACTCWHGLTYYTRGCGVPPTSCDVQSFRRANPPDAAVLLAANGGNSSGGASSSSSSSANITLLISTDPQPFRVGVLDDYASDSVARNRALVRAMNNVTLLEEWTDVLGGGPVAKPVALTMLGDMAEGYLMPQTDVYRYFYDPSFPDNADDLIAYPTYPLLGNHDYINNVGDCSDMSVDKDHCARTAVSMMRTAISPQCDTGHWTNFPTSSLAAFDVGSMSYSFIMSNYRFVALHYNPLLEDSALAVTNSMAWLGEELAVAAAAKQQVVLLMHWWWDLGLETDPTFIGYLLNYPVVALFHGHIHVRPWGWIGNFPNTSVPVINCGAAWWNVFCIAEFTAGGFRMAPVVHYGDGYPLWFGAARFEFNASSTGGNTTRGLAYAANPTVVVGSNSAAGLRGWWGCAFWGAGSSEGWVLMLSAAVLGLLLMHV